MAHFPSMSRSGRTAGLLSLVAAAWRPCGRRQAPPTKAAGVPGAQPPRVTLSHPTGQAARRRLVDGKPFTSYIWPGTLKKPTLYPIRSGDGVVVTRGFPPAAGERADHPHHVGLWFNYGDVNGYDFWNHSDAIHDPARLEKMGRIVHVGGDPDGRAAAATPSSASHAAGSPRRTARRWSTRRRRSPSAPPRTACASIDRATYLRPPARTSPSPTTRKACSACASAAPSRIRPRRAASSSTPPARSPRRDALDPTGVTGVYTSSEGKIGRQGLGHARQVDDARRHGRRPAGDDRHPRPPRQPGLPDLLARARLRPVRRQPARPGGVQRGQGEAELRA